MPETYSAHEYASLFATLTNQNVFLTGKAGTGKTTFLHRLRETSPKQIAVVAPTGVAAINAGGTTIHSFFQLPLIPFIPTEMGRKELIGKMKMQSNRRKVIRELELLIIDEIGRGTSTFDGLSIAWAVLEYIADKERCGAKTLFATHYHELTELEGKLQGIKNYRISVKEVGDDIIFLRKIVRGGADKSFGIQVARLAGLPQEVIKRAKDILHELEASDINIDHDSILDKANAGAPQQITLFGPASPDDIMQELRNVDVNSITPMEALNMIYDLHLRAKLR